ncbi:MAG: NADH-quinone oxidoreductase subunit A [Microscillaceae bacterium]|nr:NADH-quinone oxidoreductase subunit A [Microscillaceae bacterium]MDW8460233.1 NADH-quinone oxidoreductase subunit A [Cytophagales bacterium]
MKNELSGFGTALLFIIAGIFFMVVALFTSSLLRPARPNVEKLATYECGEDIQGYAWGRFNVRFYLVALIFILFEVELIFLFPWAVVFGQKALLKASPTWGRIALIEMTIFTFLLVLGLAYVWAKGYLSWVKPQPKTEPFESPVPQQLYDKINEKYVKKLG